MFDKATPNEILNMIFGTDSNSILSEDYIEPKNYKERSQNLKTPTGLRDMVGLFGSTHDAADWRKQDAFKSALGKESGKAFNPQVSDWDPSYASLEAEAMKKSSTLLFRLENKDIKNGSLGSLAEIGLALVSAVLRGQRLIISIEDNFAASLQENPSVAAQYEAFETLFDSVQNLSPGTITVHRGNNLEELGEIAKRSLELQRTRPLEKFNRESFVEMKKTRQQKEHPYAVVTGSGRAFSRAIQLRYENERERITAALKKHKGTKRDLTQGAMGQAWDLVYSSNNPDARKALFLVERDEKLAADTIVIPIHDEALTKAGTTEIGWFLLNALFTGQDVHVLMESFKPEAYLTAKKLDMAIQTVSLPLFRDSLMRQGKDGQSLMTEQQLAKISDADLELVREIFDKNPVDFKALKKTAFRDSSFWQESDNTQRVRGLVVEHLKTLNEDMPELFTFSETVASLEEKLTPPPETTPTPVVASVPSSTPFASAVTESLRGGGTAVSNELALLAQDIIRQQEATQELQGTKNQIEGVLSRLLGLRPDQLIISQRAVDLGPNMMPNERGRLTVSIRLNSMTPAQKILEIDSINQLVNGYRNEGQLDSAQYILSVGRLKSELDKIVRPEKYRQVSPATASANVDSLWWKD